MIKYFVEFLGTFTFLTVILMATKKDSSLANIAPLAIGLALIASICMGGSISGGHFNPAVSCMMYLRDNTLFSEQELAGYIVVQILAAVCALYFFKYTEKKI